MRLKFQLISVISAFLLYLSIGIGPGTRASASANSLVAWGSNSFGQLGDGTTNQTNTPVSVGGLNGLVSVLASGYQDSYAIADGGLYSWGFNWDGELGDGGSELTSVTPVTVSGLGSGVTAVSAGVVHVLAVKNGALYTWGFNADGELGNGTNNATVIPQQITSLSSGVTAIAAGSNHSLAIQNGAVYAWGLNSRGMLGNGTHIDSNVPVAVSGLGHDVTMIATGFNHNLAVQNGALYGWGWNAFGQVGNGDLAADILTPVPVTGLTAGVTSIATGIDHSLAVKDGNVFAWGGGVLGDGTTNFQRTPQLIDPDDLHNIIAVAAGGESSYALSADGSLWVWGDNTYGELGLGTEVDTYLTPQHLVPPEGYTFAAIASNGGDSADHILAVLEAIPEPSSIVLLALGGLVIDLVGVRRKRVTGGRY